MKSLRRHWISQKSSLIFTTSITFRKRVFITLNIQKEKTYMVLSRCDLFVTHYS
ncbi:protein of unknown function [Streptococcus thermophilus]|nr:protein of unknown function [Streptococcus thermophilus]CAD0147950.1 protein of unknown function [Streptococcus thermophilus]CAD0149784.1 protein of unknown function [Streptococcus thermophilus]